MLKRLGGRSLTRVVYAAGAARAFAIIGAGRGHRRADADIQGGVAGQSFGAGTVGAAGKEAGARYASLVGRALTGASAFYVGVVDAEVVLTHLPRDALAVRRARLGARAVDTEVACTAAICAGDALRCRTRRTNGTQARLVLLALVVVHTEGAAETVDANRVARAVSVGAAALGRFGDALAGGADLVAATVGVDVAGTRRLTLSADATVDTRAVSVRRALVLLFCAEACLTNLSAGALRVRGAGALARYALTGAADFILRTVTVAAAAIVRVDTAVI